MATQPMKITQLFIYPVKSLPGTSLTTSALTPTGLQYDRTFMLLRVLPDATLKNMHVADNPQMTLFRTSLLSSTCEMRITHLTSPGAELIIPLQPTTTSLAPLDIVMHSSPTQAHNMGDPYNAWFSERFGYPVVLAYLGSHTRPILGTFAPAPPPEIQPASWLSYVPFFGSGAAHATKATESRIGFADCAAFLVVTEASLGNASERLGEGIEVDVRRFRANIVIGGVKEPWVEDFWGEIAVKEGDEEGEVEEVEEVEDEEAEEEGEEKGDEEVSIILTKNCVRCKSINIDYETGAPAEGPAGTMFKKLMRDRRVDKGSKYTPVFGRYGYLGKGKRKVVSVGDEVYVTKLNDERSIFDWPTLTN